MRPSFRPQLINDPFDDPGVLVAFGHQNRALLFDLGEIQSLAPRDILKITHVFVTHTHMDHFCGLDRLVRLMLGREKTLHLYGPEGFIEKVGHKLAGYTWNLVNHYNHPFEIVATEVSNRHRVITRFSCQGGFKPAGRRIRDDSPLVCLQEPDFTVTAAVLDHRIPCLGFRLQQRFHVNIIASRLTGLGLEPGPWLQLFKKALYRDLPPDTAMADLGQIPQAAAGMTLGRLASEIAKITAGQVIAYIADAIFDKSNYKLMLELAAGADQLFIEAAFLEADRQMAARKYHLTAAQAGLIAGKAGARKMTIFHHSPRYMHQADKLRQEARRAYCRALAESQDPFQPVRKDL